jgi:tetratricopeptide (TPR) repeat protein
MFEIAQSKKLMISAIKSVAVSIIVLAGAAFAAGDAAYNSGLEAYKKKDFKLAAQQFQTSVAQGNKKPIALLYLGHSYVGLGDVAQSLKAYCTLADKYPSSGEAVLAFQQIQRLDPSAVRKYPALATAAIPGSASKQALAAGIIVTEPKFGHAPVRPQTVAIVKKAIVRLDPRFSKMLADGGATITINPNTIDRWPDGGGDTLTLPAAKNTLLAEAGGQTYHRDNTGPDINIFERPIIRNTKQLKEPFSDESLLNTTIHEMGHGVDDLQKMSVNPTFIAAHTQDVKELSTEDRALCSYFTMPMEACAEITGGLIAHNEAEEETARVIRCFPRCAKFIKQQLGF